MDWAKIKTACWHILWPRICPCCLTDLAMDAEKPLCPDCAAKLRLSEPPYCLRCAEPLPSGPRLCPGCRKLNGACRLIRGAFLYKEPAVSLIHSFKYRGNRTAAVSAGGWMGRLWPRFPELAQADLLVPVPLSPRRLRERGYNQALLLAEEASKWCGISCAEVLDRVRNTRPQWRLGRQQRQENVAAAFGLKPAARVEGLNIVLIDDVCTTGSSLEACARILLDAKAKTVSAYVLARESLPQPQQAPPPRTSGL